LMLLKQFDQIDGGSDEHGSTGDSLGIGAKTILLAGKE
jgi:hypothetical protein